MPVLSRRRITKRLVAAMRPGDILWDAELRGFGVRCQRGARTFVLKRRVGDRQRWVTIGVFGAPWTVETARTEAVRLVAKIADGADVAALRHARRDEPCIADLCARYLAEHAAEHKKPSSARSDRKNVENHVRPVLGKLHVAALDRADVERFKRLVREGATARRGTKSRPGYRGGAVVTGGPGVANRCLALLSKMMNLAEVWDWRAENSNPCRHVARYPECRRERYLSSAELTRLGEALTEAEAVGSEGPYVVGAIRLLALTGARLGEILTLRWTHVDLERRMLVLPDSKTGRKTVYLSSPAVDLLAGLPRLAGNPFVIPGGRAGAHLVNLEKPWGRIRSRAGLTDVRIHDLRHSYASLAAAHGLSLPIIGRLLGHARASTTERYAHLAAEPLREANELIGARLSTALRR